MNLIEELESLVVSAKADFAKFEKGTDVAGLRVRKSTMAAKNKSDEIRKYILTMRKIRKGT